MNLQARCSSMRANIVRMSRQIGLPHIAPSLSVVEILAVLYGRFVHAGAIKAWSDDRDRVILSKGHAALAQYAALAEFSILEPAKLRTFGAAMSPLAVHPQFRAAPGIEASTGSLGHGLALGGGMALAALLSRKSFAVYVILGDGECQEGAIWESALVASKLGLRNLVAIVDCNRLQSKARTSEVEEPERLVEKWRAFGWAARSVDGHSFDELTEALHCERSRPTVLIARTIKGKGIEFMEDRVEWHNRALTDEELERAMAALESS